MIRKITESRLDRTSSGVFGDFTDDTGNLQGRVSVVFTKAINICMECIGIG